MNTKLKTLAVVDKSEIAHRLKRAFASPDAPMQKEVAARCNVPESTLSRWLIGKIAEGALEVTQVGCALGLRPDELYLSDELFTARTEGAPRATQAEQAQLAALNESAHRLAQFTGPEGIAILKDHCDRLADSFQAQTEGKARPAGPSYGPEPARPGSSPLRLPEEQGVAFLNWLLGEVEKMPRERPLTIACRVVATQLARENFREPWAQKLAESLPKKGTDAAGAPSAKAPARPTGRRKGGPSVPSA